MLYKVSKLYSRGTDIPIAEFKETSDAKMFINARLAEDARLKVKVTYRLFEGLELLEEFDSVDSAGQSSASGSSAGASQKTSFQPTPFNASPRPPGLPHNWLKDEDTKEGEGNK